MRRESSGCWVVGSVRTAEVIEGPNCRAFSSIPSHSSGAGPPGSAPGYAPGGGLAREGFCVRLVDKLLINDALKHLRRPTGFPTLLRQNTSDFSRRLG